MWVAKPRKQLVITSIDLFALSCSSPSPSSWQQAGRLWAGRAALYLLSSSEEWHAVGEGRRIDFYLEEGYE